GKLWTHLYRAYDLHQVCGNGAGLLDSCTIAMGNRQLGCRADGTGCPVGVTGQTPALLLQLTGSTAGVANSNLNNRASDFDTFNIGNFANFVDSLTGAVTFCDRNSVANSALTRNCFSTNRQFDH